MTVPILIVGAGGYATIQLAVNAASDGDTIVVQAGTYVEQVVVTGRNGLTIVAEEGAAVTIRAPDDLVETARSSSDREIHSIFTATNSSAITLQDIRLDGHGVGSTVDEGGGAGIANFYGAFYRNASGTLENVDITGIRDPYPGGTTPGGQPIVNAIQRGISVVVDNDSVLPFAMHGGTIDDFQKQAGVFVRADLDISGVTVIGGGAQPVIAQNGFSIQRSTGTVSGNSITGIGYAGPAEAYSGVILASSNFDLSITDNIVGGSNIDSAAAKVVGIWIYRSSVDNSGGVISGNTISFTDVGIAVDDAITPRPLFIENNSVTNGDLTDPYSAGVRFEPTPITLATAFDIDGTAMHDRISGNAGDDILLGLAGDDALRGNAGNDTLDGGTGADTMTGGTGDDLYFVDDPGDTVLEADGEGTDEVRTAIPTYALPANVEKLSGTLTGSQDLRGNSGDNRLVSENGQHNDIFRLQDGGNDHVSGFGGNDFFYFGAALTAADTVDGGADKDELAIQGNYTGANRLVMSGVTNVEALVLLAGSDARFGDVANASYSYDVTTTDSTVAAGARLIVDANRLRSTENFTFDGSAELDGGFFIFAGKGVDRLIGGAQADVFLFRGPGNFTAADRVNGGGGFDELVLRGDYTGDYAVTFAGTTVTSIEAIVVVSGKDLRYGKLAADYSYDLKVHDNNLGDGQTMIVDAGTLREAESLTFDGSSETGGRFTMFGGRGNDVLIGGGGNDSIRGGEGADTLTGNGGNDTFVYRAASESTPAGRDAIQDFNLGDLIDLSGIDADVLTDGDQAFVFIGNAAFSRTAGELRFQSEGGPIWLVQGDIDGNGTADFEVFLVISPADPITTSDFIL